MSKLDDGRNARLELVDTKPIRSNLGSWIAATTFISVPIAGALLAGPVGLVIGFALVCFIATVRAVTYLFIMMVPAVHSPRAGARLSVCTNNLRNIGQALRQYELAKESFPAVCTLDPRGQPLTSWRTLILRSWIVTMSTCHTIARNLGMHPSTQ
jgi:hypothetical protein